MPEISRLQLVAYVAAGLVVVALGVRFMQAQARGAPGGTPVAAPASGRDEGAEAPSGAGAVRIGRSPGEAALVHVAGAVRRPGVYRLRAGARVKDAVERAGGTRAGADVNAINLAAKVADGQQVVVPRRVAASTSSSAGATAAGAAGAAPAAPISLNTATLEQLDTLDGIGPATAQKIVAWRTEHGGFRSVEDLGQVPGIGPKRMEALRERVQP